MSNTLPDQSDLDEFIGYNLKRAYMLVRTDFRSNMGKDGLSPTSLAALSFIVQQSGVTQSELARQLGIERSGMVSIVDELERRGYVSRSAVPGDRRVQALVPSAKGKTAYKNTLISIRSHEDSLFSDFTNTEKQQLLLLLQKLRQLEGC